MNLLPIQLLPQIHTDKPRGSVTLFFVKVNKNDLFSNVT